MAFYFAVHVGSSRTTLALVSDNLSDIVGHERIVTADLLHAAGTFGQHLAQAITASLSERRVDRSEIIGVGVGVPGTLDASRRVVGICPNLPMLNGQRLVADLEDALDLPVAADNNANLETLGEHQAGCAKGVSNLALISVGSGLGAGLILDGQLYRGPSGVAGEFGHMNSVPQGRLCSCGAYGCLEMYCSGHGLAVDAAEILTPDQLAAPVGPARALIEQALAGNQAARDVLESAFTHLGIGVASLINLLNPSMVVLEGSLALAWQDGLKIVQDVVAQQALSDARSGVDIRLSTLAPYAGIMGAATLVAQATRA